MHLISLCVKAWHKIKTHFKANINKHKKEKLKWKADVDDLACVAAADVNY